MGNGVTVDAEAIRKLAEILRDTDLTEIEVSEKEARIRVARVITAAPVAAPEVTICTSNTRTVEPATRVAGAIAAEKAVVSGAVVLKPSSETPTIAAKFCELMREAGLPPRALSLVVGSGGTIGDLRMEVGAPVGEGDVIAVISE